MANYGERSHHQLEVGAFVHVCIQPYANWGTGKFLGVAEGRLGRVQYFDAPGAETAAIAEIPLEQIKRSKLPPQTRVYRRHAASRWQVGRVLEDDAEALTVQFPNGESVNVEAADLQVRWNQPLRDPLPLLISEATETPFLADARSAFARQVALQYTAASGITAALSPPIELVDYQFEVVKRVLTDPVQRYLLADEVGLGKTIEAGIIVRQYFLDAADTARAVILTPATLVPQWRRELSGKFGLAPWLDDFLHVVSHDELDDLEELLPAAGMLVVDEAHHLSRSDDGEDAGLYGLLQEYTPRIPRLLLLSATPVLSDPAGFLRVLHLLDPVMFPLDDLDGLRQRIDTRQIVAEVVAALAPGNLWGLPQELDRLQSAFGEDIVLREKIDALRVIIAAFPEEDDEAYIAALDDLKTHLTECYRLHRRMLRNRRKTVGWATPGRAGLTRISFKADATERWRHRIDELRYRLGELWPIPAPLRSALLNTAVNSRETASMRDLLQQHGISDDAAVDIATALDSSSLRLREGLERFEALARAVEAVLATPNAQAVVFCTQRADADRATERLRHSFGAQIVRHELRGDDEDDTAMPWQQFLSAPNKVRVLVCDASAEEGVNLHGGKKIAIHFDMPGSPNRCEQRMGRLDRFGVGDAVISIALQDELNADEIAWLDTLDAGWDVFNRSVASLQYLIESTCGELAEDWLLRGTEAIEDHCASLSGPNGRVATELKNIDLQDRLDSLDEPRLDTLDPLTDCDQAWRDWRGAFSGFAIGALGFRVRWEGSQPANGADEVFRVGYVHQDDSAVTLIPMGGYLRTFLQSVDVDAPNGSSRAPLSYPYVFNRRNALTRAARAQAVRVLRVGDPLVTALEDFCAQDDRGRAFAMWRVDREYDVTDPSGADLFFRFDFVIRPSAVGTERPRSAPNAYCIEGRALDRKMQTFFPPVFVRIWVDGTGAIVPGPNSLMSSPYQNSWQGSRRDFNLNPARWRALPSTVQSTWMRNWSGTCGEARGQAAIAALASDACQEHIQHALKALDHEFRLRRAQAESRLARLDSVQRRREIEELEHDEARYAAMRSAISEPTLELDVAGALFLASDHPFEQ